MTLAQTQLDGKTDDDNIIVAVPSTLSLSRRRIQTTGLRTPNKALSVLYSNTAPTSSSSSVSRTSCGISGTNSVTSFYKYILFQTEYHV